MAAKKKKRATLPNDFEQQLRNGDLAALKQVFETCEIDAYARGYSKTTAVLMTNCPDELARWLVAQGANIKALDPYGRTVLHNAVRSRRDIAVLIELGCDIHARDRDGETPLHAAAGARNLTAIEQLLAAGADIHAKTTDGLTSLEVGLRRCYNAHIVEMVKVSKAMFKAGAQKTPAMKKFVQEIGEKFEFHRAAFNKDSVEETSAALVELCALFDVEPPAQRTIHDGKAPIKVTAKTWQRQFDELWKLLVPSRGPAATIQGELIRISGRLSDEIARNGGGNWNLDYKKMAQTFMSFVRFDRSLEDAEVSEAQSIIDEIIARKGGGEHDHGRLAELAVRWVRQNPQPLKLDGVPYGR